MPLKSLEKVLLDELKDLYSAENQILKALPKMARAASSPLLKEAFTMHIEQTRGQVERLDRVAQLMGEKSFKGKKCKAMEGLLEEGQELIEEGGDPAVLDAAMIGAAQKVEHYEMAGYGTARTHARHLGLEQVARLLQETLDEEGQTDKNLTKIAQRKINLDAKAEGDGKGSSGSSRSAGGRKSGASRAAGGNRAAAKSGSSRSGAAKSGAAKGGAAKSGGSRSGGSRSGATRGGNGGGSRGGSSSGMSRGGRAGAGSAAGEPGTTAREGSGRGTTPARGNRTGAGGRTAAPGSGASTTRSRGAGTTAPAGGRGSTAGLGKPRRKEAGSDVGQGRVSGGMGGGDASRREADRAGMGPADIDRTTEEVLSGRRVGGASGTDIGGEGNEPFVESNANRGQGRIGGDMDENRADEFYGDSAPRDAGVPSTGGGQTNNGSPNTVS